MLHCHIEELAYICLCRYESSTRHSAIGEQEALSVSVDSDFSAQCISKVDK